MYLIVCVANSFFFCYLSPFAVLGTIPNYAVWQEGLLRIEFNSSKNCTSYILFRQSTEIDDMPDITSGDSINFITFTIPSVSILFNTVNMSVRAEDSSGQPVYQRFFIYTQGCVMLHSSTCICTNLSIIISFRYC